MWNERRESSCRGLNHMIRSINKEIRRAGFRGEITSLVWDKLLFRSTFDFQREFRHLEMQFSNSEENLELDWEIGN